MTIIEVLDELGIPHRRGGEHHHVRYGWVGIDCPLCSPGSGSFKLGLNPPAASCWQCGIQSLPWMLHISASTSYGRVRGLLQDIPRSEVPEDRPKGRLQLPQGLGPLLSCHRRYLAGRGIDPDEAERLWGVQGIGLAPKLSWRIFLPVMLNKRTLSWTTRSIGSNPMRYVSARPEQEATPHKELLFGEHLAWHAVLVVEGPLDAMRVGPGAVATMGTSYTKAQVRRLGKFPLRGVCFDAEPAAQRRARRLCEELSAFPGVTSLMELRTGKDPGSCGEPELQELREMLK